MKYFCILFLIIIISISVVYKLIALNGYLLRMMLICIFTYGINFIYQYHLNKKYPQKAVPELKISPDSIFVFDLHGVIFKLSALEVIKEILKSRNKPDLISTIFYPKLFYNVFSSLYKGEVAEEVLLSVEKKFPKFKSLIPLGFNIINAQKPLPQTVALIKTLKQKNYRLYILSNIGQTSMDILKNKFPDIFAYFDGVLATNPEDCYLKKPNPAAFEKYLIVFKHNKADLIFIDDKIKNIISARSVGIPSVLFLDAQNLRMQLKNLNTF